MKKQISITLALIAALLQSACGDIGDNPAFGDGGSTSGTTAATHIASRTNFKIEFSEWALDAIDANTGSTEETSTEIIVSVGDNEGVPIEGQVVQIRKEWGTLSASACVTDSTGECSVTWTTSDFQLAPDTNCVSVVAYTTGEEAYVETNINDNTLDPIDAASTRGNTAPYSLGFWDMGEPYLDHNYDGFYNAADGDINIDINGNYINDPADTLFNGANCTATDNQCTSTATTTTIWDANHIDLRDEGKILPVATPPADNVCQQNYLLLY